MGGVLPAHSGVAPVRQFVFFGDLPCSGGAVCSSVGWQLPGCAYHSLVAQCGVVSCSARGSITIVFKKSKAHPIFVFSVDLVSVKVIKRVLSCDQKCHK